MPTKDPARKAHFPAIEKRYQKEFTFCFSAHPLKSASHGELVQ
jgi:hypothetical protein